VQIYIAVIGGAFCPKEVEQEAYEVGREIAQRGAWLVCGGLMGVMDAAAKGVKDAGGFSIGILPSDDRIGASPYLDVSIPTGVGFARNLIVVLSADAVIAIDGESGTLSEIGYALRYNKPVIGLHTWKLTSYSGICADIIAANNPKQAVDLAIKAARGNS
jgi:uncharacterized protein (TIGR00725 family)